MNKILELQKLAEEETQEKSEWSTMSRGCNNG